jgi:hypothetical protein
MSIRILTISNLCRGGIYKTMSELLAVEESALWCQILAHLLMLLLLINIHESRGFMFMRASFH